MKIGFKDPGDILAKIKRHQHHYSGVHAGVPVVVLTYLETFMLADHIEIHLSKDDKISMFGDVETAQWIVHALRNHQPVLIFGYTVVCDRKEEEHLDNPEVAEDGPQL